MKSIFEKASRMKLRFATENGNLTVEDLWDISLTSSGGTSLDALAKHLNRKTKDSKESFVTKSVVDPVARLKFKIVKHVIDVKLADAEKAVLAKEQKDRKNRLIEILGQKQDQELLEKSADEIQDLISKL